MSGVSGNSGRGAGGGLVPCLVGGGAARMPVVAAASTVRAASGTKGGDGGGTRKAKPYVKAISGMCGGFVEACSLQPLDVAKTRMQLDRSGTKYKGLLHTVRTIASEEGAGALYKGLTPFVTHLTIKYALRFGAFGYFRTLLPKGDSEGSQNMLNFMAGLGSGITEAIIVVTPFEVVKTRLQQQHGLDKSQLKYKGPIHAARTIVREEGARAMWKGVVPTMVRQGSNQAFNFMSFYAINKFLYGKRDGDAQPLAVWQTASTGLVAAAIGPICNCPMDVLKTRFMAQVTVAGQTPKYTSVTQAIKLIVKEEGVLALWKGLFARLARLAPGQAITWSVVSRIQWYIENQV